MAETTKLSHDIGHNIKIGKNEKKSLCIVRTFVHSAIACLGRK